MTVRAVSFSEPDYAWPNVEYTTLVKTEAKDFVISSSMAVQALADWNFERQRNLTKDHIVSMIREMRLGNWEADVTICVLPDNSKFITNGYHTLNAISQIDKYWVTVKYRFCRDIEEVRLNYIRIDANKNRTTKDKIRAMHGSVSRFEANTLSSTRYIARVIGASSFPTRLTPEEEDKHYNYYVDARAKLLEAINGGVNFKIVCEQAPLAIALITMQQQPEKAAAFWRAVSYDDGLVRGNPAKAFLNYYHEAKRKRLIGGERARRLARAACLAWNAYLQNRQIERLRPETGSDFALAGCTISTYEMVIRR